MRARRWLLRGLAAVGLITVMVICTPVDLWWAHAYSGRVEQPKGEVLIVLSAAADDHGVLSYTSYWRARYALLAWQGGGFQKIVISGGGGPGILNFLAAEGVPRDALVQELESKTTRENALDARPLVAGLPGRKVLLTSDFHMWRAVRVFRKAGIEVTPMAVPDVLKAGQRWNGRFQGFQTLVLETCKIVYYKLRGWI